MPSLSEHDPLGSFATLEDNYQLDVDSGVEGMETLLGNYKGRAEKHFILGNHEARIDRAIAKDPKWWGKVSIKDLQLKKFGWNVTPYKESLELAGILFSHHFPSGTMGRPIGGKNMASSMIRELMVSAVAGHAHIMDHAERTNGRGQKVFALSAGCYTHPNYAENDGTDMAFKSPGKPLSKKTVIRRMRSSWAKGSAPMWWRGIVLLDGLDGCGYYDDFRKITQRQIELKFG